MELFGHAQRMCKNITVLTGLPCTVAKGNAKAPCGNPASCTQTACLSRRSGRHLYQCPCGRTFLITSLHQPKTQDVCHIIVGPFAIEQTEEPLIPLSHMRSLLPWMKSCRHWAAICPAED